MKKEIKNNIIKFPKNKSKIQIFLIIIGFLLFIMLSNNLFKGFRFDLTENKLISPSKVIALNDKRAEAVTAAIVKEFGIKDELKLKGIIRNALSDFMFDADINVDENTTTGGGAGSASFTPGTGMQYATPYAFTGGKKAKEPKALKDLGYKLVKK